MAGDCVHAWSGFLQAESGQFQQSVYKAVGKGLRGGRAGIPNDPTGNGGGYVFDCRAVNNPGKYERYKPFTGLDEPVIRFLEEDGEIFPFLNAAYSLVDASVKRYMERGFSNLSVCFGCTGGQHRSVYSAQHMAEHINKKFGVKVELIHREQNIEQTFERTL